jgi:hypothetical protein
VEQLRSEILEAHNARSDLLKWKLALVAGFGTIGLGLTQEIGHPIVLIGIPLICAYVDLLTRHLTLRIHVIGDFLRSRPVDAPETPAFLREYEAFVEHNRSAFSFEDWALYLSSIVLSLAVAIYGVILLGGENETTRAEEIALVVMGLGGALIAYAIDRSYHEKRSRIAAP